MEEAVVNSMAPEHLPGFIPGVDGSDPLFTFIAIFVVAMILGIGALYFTLHALPEQLAHKAGHTQMQVVGILALLALFTHNNMFWVVALLLAAFRVPDFLTPMNSIAGSLERMSMSGVKWQASTQDTAAPQPGPDRPDETAPDTDPSETAANPDEGR